MCMQLDGALNPLPIMAALMVLPRHDDCRNLLWVPLPKRAAKQISLWLAMMLCSNERWQFSLVFPAAPLSDMEMAEAIQNNMKGVAREGYPMDWQAK